MMQIQCVPARIADVYAVYNALRYADELELRRLGGDPKRIMRDNFRHSFLRRTLFVDGEPAAIAGCYGSALSDEGLPYLFTTPEVERAPIAFVREAKRLVEEMLAIKSVLIGNVDAGYKEAQKLLEQLGFVLGDPEPWPVTGALFRSFERRR